MLEKQKKAAPEPESSSDSMNGGPEGRRGQEGACATPQVCSSHCRSTWARSCLSSSAKQILQVDFMLSDFKIQRCGRLIKK